MGRDARVLAAKHASFGPVKATEKELAASINEQLVGLDRTLGLELSSASVERIEARLRIDERHLQIHGIVHGGVYTSIVETLGSVGAWISGGPERQPVVGVDNHTSFVRPVRGGSLHAVAEPIHCGRRTRLWQVRIEDDDGKLAATGRLLAMVVEDPRARSVPESNETEPRTGSDSKEG
jgi:uncharacterized protein (TIGR00369 family)